MASNKDNESVKVDSNYNIIMEMGFYKQTMIKRKMLQNTMFSLKYKELWHLCEAVRKDEKNRIQDKFWNSKDLHWDSYTKVMIDELEKKQSD